MQAAIEDAKRAYEAAGGKFTNKYVARVEPWVDRLDQSPSRWVALPIAALVGPAVPGSIKKEKVGTKIETEAVPVLDFLSSLEELKKEATELSLQFRPSTIPRSMLLYRDSSHINKWLVGRLED